MIITMRKVIVAEAMRMAIAVEVIAAVDVAELIIQWKAAMWEKPAVLITKEHSMTEPSLILLMIVGNRWNLFVV